VAVGPRGIEVVLQILSVERIRSAIGDDRADHQLRIVHGEVSEPEARTGRKTVDRVLLVPVHVDDNRFDREKAVVSGNAELEGRFVALTNGGSGLDVDARHREIDEQRRVFLTAERERAPTDEGNSEGPRSLSGSGGLRFQSLHSRTSDCAVLCEPANANAKLSSGNISQARSKRVPSCGMRTASHGLQSMIKKSLPLERTPATWVGTENLSVGL